MYDPGVACLASRRRTVLLLGLVLSVWPCLAQPPTGPTDPRELRGFLDGFFAEHMESLHVPGAVFVLVKDGEVFFSKGYGFADLERKAPVDPDRTLFRVGSITKLFTATAVMQLHERGKLDLDGDVNVYLERIALEDTYPDPVTLKNLLTHTGGFDDSNIGQAVLNESEVEPLGDYLARRIPARVTPPGNVVSYSNHGLTLAGYVVQEISGLPFAEYVERNILQPLGMERSGLGRPPGLARGYVHRGETYEAVPFEYYNIGPACSLSATATDMARFMIAHLQDGRFEDVRILEETTAREMHRQQFANHPDLPGFAYGFYEKYVNGRRSLEHGGAIRGFYSLLVLLPDDDCGFFVSSNNFGFGVEGRFLIDFRREFMDRYFPSPTEVVAGKSLPGSKERAARLAGSYRFNRVARGTLDKYLALIGKVREIRVREAGEGALTVGGRRRRYVEVEPFLYRREDGRRTAGFREAEGGNPGYLFINSWAYERIAWYETRIVQRRLMIGIALILASTLLAWPALRRRHPDAGRFAHLAWILASVVGVLQLAFMAGLVVALPRDPLEVWTGLPPAVTALLVLPLLALPPTLGLPVLNVLAWKDRYWGAAGRVHHTLICLAALTLIPIWHYWNLLGFRF